MGNAYCTERDQIDSILRVGQVRKIFKEFIQEWSRFSDENTHLNKGIISFLKAENKCLKNLFQIRVD